MFEIDEGTVSTPTAPCAYAGSEFILNANSEGQAQHHVLPNCGRKRAPSSCEPTPRSPPAGGSLVGS